MIGKSKKIVLAALFAALCYIMTLVIPPIPMPTGYVNLGDVAVLLGSWVLGPFWGGAAAGVGSALADLMSYPAYAPATFLIKFAMGVVAALLFRTVKTRMGSFCGMLVGAVVAEAIMVGGYFVYESLVLGVGAAAVASVPFNLVQGAVGIVVSVTAAVVLERSGILKRLK